MYDRARFMCRKMHNLYGTDCLTATYGMEEPDNRKPLVVNGAQQVGKTWLLREFARKCYKKEAYVVCRKYKGEMTEQFVLQEMKSKGIAPIYYHTTDNSRLELDFVVQWEGGVVPIEVKAEGNVRANSLTTLLGKRPDLHAERYSMLPYKAQGSLTNIPLYAV